MRGELRKKKVLHVIDGFGAGGAETWLLAMVKYLKLHPELGIEFDFLATGGEPRLFDEEVIQLGSRIFYYKYSFRNWFGFRKFIKKLQRDNVYDVIHDHQDFVSGWHFLFGLGYMPAIKISHLHNPYNFVHNYVVNTGRWFSFRVGRMLMALLTSKITGTSNAVMDEYGYDKWPYVWKRIVPAYCGFDIERFKFNSLRNNSLRKELGWDLPGIKVCLFVGRIGLHDYDTALNQKNPGFAMQVAKELVNQNENWRFLFVGYKGKFGGEMELELKDLGLSDKIRFLGLRQDVEGIMSTADIFIFPSLWEGLGMVAVEAQANGLQIIMSDTVPQEAVVCPELVVLMKLNIGAQNWARFILETDTDLGDRSSYAIKVGLSPFSIENSMKNLIQIYT